jgi:hypothetical protein
MQTYLLKLYKGEFDLVISFCGSYSCSPELARIFEESLDPRFMFDGFTVEFLQKLREQQERLKLQGTPRNVLLLFDDCDMTPEQHTELGFFATRARHFRVSMFFSSVSYTSIPKSYRRSLDFLLLFSVPMSSDKKLLLQEYSRNPSFASWCINQLEKYQCLVLESSHKQELFTYRVPEYSETARAESQNPSVDPPNETENEGHLSGGEKSQSPESVLAASNEKLPESSEALSAESQTE